MHTHSDAIKYFSASGEWRFVDVETTRRRRLGWTDALAPALARGGRHAVVSSVRYLPRAQRGQAPQPNSPEEKKQPP